MSLAATTDFIFVKKERRKERKIYIARLKAYRCIFNLPCLAENQKLNQNQWVKEKRSGREISPVSIYGEVYGGIDLMKRCVLSLEWKTEGVIDGDRGGDDSVDPTCVGYWEGERPGCGWFSRKEWGSLFQRRGAACWKEQFVILRDEEIGGLDMVTTDEDLCNRVARKYCSYIYYITCLGTVTPALAIYILVMEYR